MKICNICNQEKSLTEFNKDKCKIDGYMNFCKKCRSDKHLLNKDQNNDRCKKYYKNNKEKFTERHKIYVSKNREKMRRLYKEKNEKNKEKYSKLKLISDTERRKIDPLFKLTGNIRTLISKTIREFGKVKKSKSYEILGCSFLEFKKYLENKFLDGMDWTNYGKWHLDHIKPVSLAKSEKELLELNHYTNFQPLWAFDNISKSNKFIE